MIQEVDRGKNMPKDLTIHWDSTRPPKNQSTTLYFGMALLSFMWLLIGCQASAVGSVANTTPFIAFTEATPSEATPSPAKILNPTNTSRPPATITPPPTSTVNPIPNSTATSTPTPTATAIGPCSDRHPGNDLLTLITLEYGISRDYAPSDLVDISGRFPVTVTLGYPTQVRRVVLEPLSQMVEDMIDAGLRPQIISGYRSYSAQAIAWSKWLEKVPESAAIVSAPPGHSEHQLGTTIDFGSPELAEIVQDEDIEFHTYFYKTGEGMWLEENAHRHGFTLSYSREAFELTGLYYEPWHYRYIGPELATELKQQGLTLAEYLLDLNSPPCIP